MAKRNAEAAAITPKELSSVTRRGIDAIRKPFVNFVKGFKDLAVSRAELAPKFIKAFGAYQKDTGGTFLSFVALLDPSVPVADRDAYRVHPSYAAAQYLRRLSGRTDTGANRARPLRSNLANLARLIATILPVMADAEAFWTGLADQFGLRPRQVAKLRQVVAASKPLVDLHLTRKVPVRIVNVEEPVVPATSAGRRAA